MGGGGSYNGGGYGAGSGFALLVVLFILLIIVGAAFIYQNNNKCNMLESLASKKDEIHVSWISSFQLDKKALFTYVSKWYYACVESN